MHERFEVMRFTRAGKPDHSFSGDGRSSARIYDTVPGYAFDESVAEAVTVDSHDRPILCGYASLGSDSDFALARFKTDGNLDGHFGDGGVQSTGFLSGSDVCTDLTIDRQRRIVAAGTNGPSFAFARYTPSGQLDPSFDGDGTTTVTPPTAGSARRAYAVAMDGSKIVAVGADSLGNGVLSRLKSDGSRDPAFGADGSLVYPASGMRDYIASLAVMDHGYVLGGGLSNGKGILRGVKENGHPDHGFSGDGRLAFKSHGLDTSVNDLARDGDKIVVASTVGSGVFKVRSGHSAPELRAHPTLKVSVQRVLPNGTVDRSYKSRLDQYSRHHYSTVTGLAAHGKRYVVAGYLVGARITVGLAAFRSRAPRHHGHHGHHHG